MANSTTKLALTKRADGRWQKKCRGRLFYFSGTYGEALKEWKRIEPFAKRGEDPPDGESEAPTVKSVLNAYLAHCERQMKAGELSEMTFTDYLRVCSECNRVLGHRDTSSLKPQDFAKLRETFGKTRSGKPSAPSVLSKKVTIAKGAFKWAMANGHIGNVMFGSTFKTAKLKLIRKRKNERKGTKTFTAAEVRLMLKDECWRPMVLLAVNCGFGNADLARVRWEHLDLDGATFDFARPKTEIERKGVLWPETVAALRKLERTDGHVFHSPSGARWSVNSNRLSVVFAEFCNSVGIEHKQGRSLYGLRHTLATVGRTSGDDAAVKTIMGHSDDSQLAASYTHEFPLDRLERVADCVRAWLFEEQRATVPFGKVAS